MNQNQPSLTTNTTASSKHPQASQLPSALNDVIFHYIFAHQEWSSCLKTLLNTVLQDSGRLPLDELTIRSPFNLAQFVGDKLSVIDVRARDTCGRWFNQQF